LYFAFSIVAIGIPEVDLQLLSINKL